VTRYSRHTLIGLQPTDTTPFPRSDGRSSGVQIKTIAFDLVRRPNGTVIMKRPAPTKSGNATELMIATGIVCSVLALAAWALT